MVELVDERDTKTLTAHSLVSRKMHNHRDTNITKKEAKLLIFSLFM